MKIVITYHSNNSFELNEVILI